MRVWEKVDYTYNYIYAYLGGGNADTCVYSINLFPPHPATEVGVSHLKLQTPGKLRRATCQGGTTAPPEQINFCFKDPQAKSV